MYICTYNVKGKDVSFHVWKNEFEDGKRKTIGNWGQVVSSGIYGVNGYSDQQFATETNNH